MKLRDEQQRAEFVVALDRPSREVDDVVVPFGRDPPPGIGAPTRIALELPCDQLVDLFPSEVIGVREAPQILILTVGIGIGGRPLDDPRCEGDIGARWIHAEIVRARVLPRRGSSSRGAQRPSSGVMGAWSASFWRGDLGGRASASRAIWADPW